MRRLVFGTAGHIDHGKTALVRAMTGQETDRLPEEKRRGISIDLGFAHLDAGDAVVSIVDVPGHERFIKNMVAGASGVDAVMLVVAADEGIMPQTREHLEIMTLLGIKTGFVVLTKIDMVDEEWLDMVEADVEEQISGTFLAERPLIRASAVSGQGIDQVLDTIRELAATVRERPDDGLPRLPVDRVFTVRGFGTVVTGTLAAGSIRVGDHLRVMPADIEFRVRNVEVHGRATDVAKAGDRTALNGGGMDRSEVYRGDVITVRGLPGVCQRLSARFTLLPSARGPVEIGTRVRLHIGTSEIMARCVPLDCDTIIPGQSALVRFNLEHSAVAFWGDRFIVRSYSPQSTIGGGKVIETSRRRRRLSERDLEELRKREQADVAGYLNIVLTDEFSVPTGIDVISLHIGKVVGSAQEMVDQMVMDGQVMRIGDEPPLYLHRQAFDHIVTRIVGCVKNYLEQNALSRGMPRERLRQATFPDMHARVLGLLLALLDERGLVEISGAKVVLPGWEVKLTDKQQKLKEEVVSLMERAKFNPPGMDEINRLGSDRELTPIIDLLVDEEVLVRVGEGVLMHGRWIRDMVETVREYFSGHEQLSVADLRDMLGTSRKFAVPLANHLDALGVTRRQGEIRVKGPRIR